MRSICGSLGLFLAVILRTSCGNGPNDGTAPAPGQALFHTSEVSTKQTGVYHASGLLHPGCAFVAWKKKIVCEDPSIDAVELNAMLEVVHHRHVAPKLTSEPAKAARLRAEGSLAAASQRVARDNGQRVRQATNRTGGPETGNLMAGRGRRAAVLMSGLIARDEGRHLRCTPRGRMRQLLATRSQVDHLFAPLVTHGFSVHLFLSTSECIDDKNANQNFTDLIRKAYDPWLAGFHTSSCKGAPDHRCLIKNALGLLDRSRGIADLGKDDLVLMTRPDLLLAAKFAALVLDMAFIALSEGTLTWPFPCEAKVWKEWKCVADTIVAAPARLFDSFREQCLGKVSCYPEAAGGSSVIAPRAAGGGKVTRSGNAGSSRLGGQSFGFRAGQDPVTGNNAHGNYQPVPWSRRRGLLADDNQAGKQGGVVGQGGSGLSSLTGAITGGGKSLPHGKALSSRTAPTAVAVDIAVAPEPFDRLSMDGSEDFNRPHGPVWNSGHGCYRCALSMIADGYSVDAAFARKENWFVNTRVQKNPYYSFAGG